MKNKLYIILIIILVVIGIYFVVKKPSVQAPTIQEQERTHVQSSSSENISSEQASVNEKISKNVVNYTDAGFNPSSLEVKAGQTVQFVNQSSGGMWVASGPHPSHTAYPEFDPKRNIPSGGTYEFTFTKIGEWKYHNHTKAGAYGTIIVK